MKISTFPKHLFWSYNNDADIPEEVIAEQVILYGELEDLFQLSELVSSDIIARVNSRIASHGHWLKRCNFVDKIILG
ncbi:MAG: hypothetical protein WCI71_03995 [Bacteroidota bacterium]